MGDPGEESVFYLVPFARAGWVVADGDIQSGGGGQSGEFEFPQPGAVTGGASSVGGEEDSPGLGISVFSPLLPPFIDGGDSEDRRVMIEAGRQPSNVFGQNVDSRGEGFSL